VQQLFLAGISSVVALQASLLQFTTGLDILLLLAFLMLLLLLFTLVLLAFHMLIFMFLMAIFEFLFVAGVFAFAGAGNPADAGNPNMRPSGEYANVFFDKNQLTLRDVFVSHLQR